MILRSVVILFSLLASASAKAQITIEQITEKWAETKRLEDAASASLRVVSEYSMSSVKNTVEWQVSKTGQCAKIVTGSKGVICWNDQYTFVLKHNKANGELRLTSSTAGAPSTNELKTAVLHNCVEGYAIFPRSWFFRTSLTEAYESKGLELLKCRTLESGLVRLDIIYRFAGGKGPLAYSGTLDVDPKHEFSWVQSAMECSQIKVASGENMKVSFHREIRPDGRVGTFKQVNNAGDFERLVYDHRDEVVPADQYRLTAFGFPEPVGVTWVKPTPRYVWWLLALGGCALVALVCRLAVRRMRRTAAAPAAA